MEKLYAMLLNEDRRKQALAILRGDSSLESQSVYIAQEIEEQASKALKHFQKCYSHNKEFLCNPMRSTELITQNGWLSIPKNYHSEKER